MAEKDFKSIAEQRALLASRGLTIEDNSAAEEFLLHNNYYRISGYSLTLRKNDKFYPSATMQNIMDIYNLDHALRHLLLEYIELIEVKMKSIYAYEIAKAHGPLSHQNPNLFSNITKHSEILAKAEQQSALLRRFMHSMTIIRNLCAHGSRLYNRIFQQKPWLSKAELSLLRKSANGTPDNAHLYGFLFIMKRMLSTSDFNEFKKKLIALSDRFSFVNMRYYGFRSDWRQRL